MAVFKKIVIANWKMNLDPGQSLKLAEDFLDKFHDFSLREVVLCPDFLSLDRIKEKLESSVLQLGAQDMFWQDYGSYTGEVSPGSLKGLGCKYVILGHSERREYLSEDYQMVNKKVKAALEKEITPIVCIGEKKEDKEQGLRDKVLSEQIERALSGVSLDQVEDLILAYEPIWAIGSGQAIEEKDIQEAYKMIKSVLKKNFSDQAQKILTIYGGSVNLDNLDRFTKSQEIDGLLLGGASLQAEDFFQISKRMLE